MIFKNSVFKEEEFWNALTHGVGALLSIVAFVFMLKSTTQLGWGVEMGSALTFGFGLIALYTASTIYHAVKKPNVKGFLRKLDHLCIYLLIAGTYTPVMLVGVKGYWGWAMFVSIWLLAILGFVFKFSSLRKNEKLSLGLYALMGWLAIIAGKPLIENLSNQALIYLLLGGLAYTVGIFFYAREKIKFNHVIWHLFVMAGSAFHFVAVFLFILP